MCNSEEKELFNSLKDYIGNLDRGLEVMVKSIHGECEKEFLDMILSAIEGLEWSINAMYITRNYHTVKDLDVLNVVLSEAIEAMENKDYILVADIFEYEVLPKVKEWKEKIVS